MRARIYQPYERLQRGSTQVDAGHGLGLAVVARCAELMAAEHGLRSRLGRGSCFWLQLAATAAVLPPEHKNTPAGMGPQSAPGAPPPAPAGGCGRLRQDHGLGPFRARRLAAVAGPQ